MTMKTLFAASILALLPALASAQCSGDHANQASMSCTDGTQWSDESGTCVPIVTG